MDFAFGNVPKLQRRIVAVLAGGQVLGGVAFGATISLGALLARDLSGQDALSGLATTAVTLGAALAAIPLASLANRHGRRLSLTLGNALALVGVVTIVASAAVRSFPMLLAGTTLVGMGNAGNLQSRFAATDLAQPTTRARDLSVVVWSTTVGGVVAPLMLTPGEQLGAAIGMPPLTGSFLFSFVAQILALVLYLVGLRPDPLLIAQALASETTVGGGEPISPDRPRVARYAIFAVSGSHAVMVGVMAMTPVHLSHMTHGTEVTTVVGVTIAIHVLGMYALAPVFGVLADRWGRMQVLLLGQVLLACSLVVAIVAGDDATGVIIALALLGSGWSAATVAGSALLTEATTESMRPRRQGVNDTFMSLAGAAGAAVAGVILGPFLYSGLAVAALIVVILVVAVAPLARSKNMDTGAATTTSGAP